MKELQTQSIPPIKYGLAIVFLLISFFSHAQSTQNEINDQVWKPFIASFNSFDTDKFLALHSKEVVRSSRESKTVLNLDQYYTQQKRGDTRAINEKDKRTLELRFTERIASTANAIEVGIYKTTNLNNKGEYTSYYGRFHVVLRKENGVWKILVDTDSSENNSIGERDFNAASPME
jgi:ketosteroid isomerase-like protein